VIGPRAEIRRRIGKRAARSRRRRRGGPAAGVAQDDGDSIVCGGPAAFFFWVPEREEWELAGGAGEAVREGEARCLG